jgi:hypothetical protein
MASGVAVVRFEGPGNCEELSMVRNLWVPSPEA